MQPVWCIVRRATMWATTNAGSCGRNSMCPLHSMCSIHAPQLLSVPGPGFSMTHRLINKPSKYCLPSLVPSTYQYPAPILSTMATWNVASSSSDVQRHTGTQSTRLPGDRLYFLAPRINLASSRRSSTCSAAGTSIPNGAAEEDQDRLQQAQASKPAPDMRMQLDQLSQRVSQELSIPVRFQALDEVLRKDCPFCHGGSRMDRNSFTIRAVDDGHVALYHCFRATCGKSGRVDVTGRHSRRSRRSEIPQSLEEPYGQTMLKFFEERGITRDALEACGVYSALVRPPVVAEGEHEDAEVDNGSTAASRGGSEGQGALVHCAVMPYKDSDGKGVSWTYMYLDAVALEEEVQGRTPIQLRSPPGYVGPRLGECTVDLKTEAAKGWVSVSKQQQQQQQQQVDELQAETPESGTFNAGQLQQQQQVAESHAQNAESGFFSAGHQQQQADEWRAETTESEISILGQQQQQADEWPADTAAGGISSAGHHQQQINDLHSKEAGSGVSGWGQGEQVVMEGHTQGDVEQQRWHQGVEEGECGWEQIQQQQEQQQQQQQQGVEEVEHVVEQIQQQQQQHQVVKGPEHESGHQDLHYAPPQHMQQRGLPGTKPTLKPKDTPGSRRNSSSSSSGSMIQAGTQAGSSTHTSSPYPPPTQPSTSVANADEALSTEEPPASPREFFVQYFRDLSLENERNGLEKQRRRDSEAQKDFFRARTNKRVSEALARREEEITLENVHELVRVKGIADKSVNRMVSLLQKWQPPQSPIAPDIAAPTTAPPTAAAATGQDAHQTATGGVGQGEGLNAKPGTRGRKRQASQQQEPLGLMRGLSTSASSPEPSPAPKNKGGRPRKSRSASALPPDAAGSTDKAATHVEPAVQAMVPENQIFVDYFTLLISLLVDEQLGRKKHRKKADEGLGKKADAYQKDLHTVAAHSAPITQDAAVLHNLNISEESEKAIGQLLRPGPNAALLCLLEQLNMTVPPSLENYPKKVTLERRILEELESLEGVSTTVQNKIKKILETQQKVEAMASKPQPVPPAVHSALTPHNMQSHEEAAPQQSLQEGPFSNASGAEAGKGEHGSRALTTPSTQGQEETAPWQSSQGGSIPDTGVAEASKGEHGGVGGESSAAGEGVYRTRSASSHDPVSRMHPSLPAATATDKGEHGSGGGKSSAAGERVYKTRSASSHDPVSRVHPNLPAAVAAAAGWHSPGAATSDGGASGEEFGAAPRARAAEHLLAGLPSVWSTEAGTKRTLWGVHDVVSFLSREEDALIKGQVREEECIEGSGKGHEPLYLYLVEDELDRLSMLMLGLPPNAVLCLPPNARRDFHSLLEEQQRQRRETADFLLPEEQSQARSWSKSRKGSTASGQGHRDGKLTGERSVLSCVTSVAESVFGDKCGRVYLALRNGPLVPGAREDGELEDALAGVLGKERCKRIRWPISLEDLPFSSPHSPDRDGPPSIPQEPSHTADPDSNPPSSPSSSPPYSSTDSFGNSSSSTASTLPTMPNTLSFPHGTGYGSATGSAFSARQTMLPLRLSANEVLVADGPSALMFIVQYQVKDWPVEGLYEMKDFAETILRNYHDRAGFSQGVSTGWLQLDQFYKVVPGELTIVTGVPNSGKSEWLDALCMNLAKQHGWAIAMASFEKSPTGHARNLLEKYVEKPFIKGQVEVDLDGREVPQEQMSMEELMAGMEFLNSHFLLIRHAVEDKVPIVERIPDEAPPLLESTQGLQEASPTIDWVLKRAVAAVKRYNIRGLVIDPFNELDRGCTFESGTEYVSQMLSKVKRFAQGSNVHVWLVAHPRQLLDYVSNKPPSLYDISGSAHFYNKADAGIVVHRPSGREEGGPDPLFNPVRIYVRKMRNKAAGTQGECVLFYKRSSGIYYEPLQEEQEEWTSK